jgi:hypothetical protein
MNYIIQEHMRAGVTQRYADHTEAAVQLMVAAMSRPGIDRVTMLLDGQPKWELSRVAGREGKDFWLPTTPKALESAPARTLPPAYWEDECWNYCRRCRDMHTEPMCP